MASLFIGLEACPEWLRAVTIEADKNGYALISAQELPLAEPDGLAAALKTLLAAPGCQRLAMALDARHGFYRQLEFPFSDVRKIAAALPYELGAQLPVNLEQYRVDSGRPEPLATGRFRVAAAAVPCPVADQWLALLEGAGFPPPILDLAPFAFLAPALDLPERLVLVHCGEAAATVGLVCAGRLASYRLLPTGPETTSAQILDFIRHQMGILGTPGEEPLPLLILGKLKEGDLAAQLQEEGHALLDPFELSLKEKSPPPEFRPALCLALRAWAGKSAFSFNFLPFSTTLVKDWKHLKNHLILSGILLLTLLLGLAGGAVFTYLNKARQRDALEKQMASIFQEAFPEAKPVANIPPITQMKSRLKELEKQGALFSARGEGSALETLREIALHLEKVPDFSVKNFSYDVGLVRLEGTTTSFDTVNTMSNQLRQSALFKKIDIVEAKKSADGHQVHFRINLDMKEEGTTP